MGRPHTPWKATWVEFGQKSKTKQDHALCDHEGRGSTIHLCFNSITNSDHLSFGREGWSHMSDDRRLVHPWKDWECEESFAITISQAAAAEEGIRMPSWGMIDISRRPLESVRQLDQIAKEVWFRHLGRLVGGWVGICSSGILDKSIKIPRAHQSTMLQPNIPHFPPWENSLNWKQVPEILLNFQNEERIICCKQTWTTMRDFGSKFKRKLPNKSGFIAHPYPSEHHFFISVKEDLLTLASLAPGWVGTWKCPIPFCLGGWCTHSHIA